MSALNNSVCNVLKSYNIKPFSFSGDTAEEIYNGMSWYDNEVPDRDEFLSKVEEETKTYLMELLRKQRNVKLSECDWVMMSDVTLDNIEEWKTYRQALRDLPSQVAPTDEDIDKLLPRSPNEPAL
tara:strand:- start:730 stop:1104 length:375 start_codon:yes stop_codon:yes gene_type:complete